GDWIWLDVEADGFLYNMVRAIAGTLINVGRGFWPETQVAQVLAAEDRRLAGAPAPAPGLFLVRVHFEETAPGSACPPPHTAGPAAACHHFRARLKEHYQPGFGPGGLDRQGVRAGVARCFAQRGYGSYDRGLAGTRFSRAHRMAAILGVHRIGCG